MRLMAATSKVKHPKASQIQRAHHLASTAIDQINLILTLGTYTEIFRNSPPETLFRFTQQIDNI